ncbi:5615_t:CDS:2 [Funneliformis mosseae]|uniref:5615_t:CDS:1 n=1 Tax=Funneliformis mosseae TaxID=27381 RepID=A0A9N8ZRD6_FUNMO|nr:5615_t:CDS:2 [Funneliformis mosseae]
MYSENDIIEMDTSFNCSILIPSSDDPETISVDIYKDNKNRRYFQRGKLTQVTLSNFKVSHLKEHICNIYDIKEVDQPGPSKQGVPQDAVDWNNVDSIYNWIKELKRPDENQKSKLVSSFGAEFPLQGRDETLQILLNGNQTRNGIRQRLDYIREKRYDKQLHHIPILANGPGTGKSRFLQELLTLLEQYRNRSEHVLGNSQVLAINITFNTITNASDEDASAGPASVALRMLYEYFISGSETLYFNQFMRMCRNWKTLKIETACDVVLKDIGGNIGFFVIGIDELNVLHNLAKDNQRPVRDIVHAIGGLITNSKKNLLYVPILAGTIQGPLEKFIQESTYDLLRLPLRLLSDEEVEKITSYMKEDQELAGCINHNKTFQRFISDIGGQVRALEIFYKELLCAIKMNTPVIDYKFVFQLVNHRLKKKYPFKEFATIMKPVVAYAILNIPVDEDDEFEIGNDKISYIDLASKGIINLEVTCDDPNKSYVRMPYIWVWITTSIKEFKAGRFWDVMINHKSHTLWQSFEEFNMRFWVLRLQLFKELNDSVTLRDLFRSAYHNDQGISLFDLEFRLPTVEKYYVELTNRYPYTMNNEHLLLGTVFKNAEGAPWDIFLFLDDYLIAIQVKSSNATAGQPQTLSKRMVESEYKKVKDAVEVMKKSFESESPIKHWVLFICTNGPKTRNCLESLERNCFVIDRENYKLFYGYTFSTRAEFSADNDQLDANTAEEYELRTISGIGDAIASAITNKRPFEDENDLYNKVKQIPMEARKKIKVTKNE